MGTRVAWTLRVGMSLCLGLIPCTALIPSAAWSATYFVDCNGLDTNPGTSSSAAWQSLNKAQSAPLKPGDNLLFKRGCSWKGPLTLGWTGTKTDPITIGVYGNGTSPEIHDGSPGNVTLSGHYLIVEYLSAKSAPVKTDPGCKDQPVGDLSGFVFPRGSSNNTVQFVKSTGHSRGVWMTSGSSNNRLVHSNIFGNVSMTRNDVGGDNDAGAFGVLLNGDSNEVAYDTLSNNFAWCSYDYGVDGSSVEIYEAKGNNIHHNISLEEGTFTELGGSRTADNVFAYNLVVSQVEASIFLNVRGPTSNWGPNLHTIAIQNTVYLTGSKSTGIICGGGCSADILTAQNNLIWVEGTAVYVDGPPVEDHNFYWKTSGNPQTGSLKLDTSSKKVNPGFVDASKNNFTLVKASPALNYGNPAVKSYGYIGDLAGNLVPWGSGPELGCYEMLISLAIGSSEKAKRQKQVLRIPLVDQHGWSIPQDAGQTIDLRGKIKAPIGP